LSGKIAIQFVSQKEKKKSYAQMEAKSQRNVPHASTLGVAKINVKRMAHGKTVTRNHVNRFPLRLVKRSGRSET